uniref:Fatty acid desaturase domain-containing protein n=2 Tax=Tetradesmus obliquus TaxID=3088 RepID=A0A383V8J9_TETOB|eukprot:jgi/Sobl393_1/3049/SZX61069.1
MVWISKSCWLKTSVEYGGPGRPSQLGVVVTNCGYSDWSTMDFPYSMQLALRVRREGSDYIVEACIPEASLIPASAASTAFAEGASLPIRVSSGKVGSPASEWTQLRICHLMEDVSPAGVGKDGKENVDFGLQLQAACEALPLSGVAAGLYACSPKPGGGFQAQFDRLHIVSGRLPGHIVQSHLLGLAYFLVNYVLFLQRFLLTLHYTEHRKLFKPSCGWLNHLAPYLLSPLFGVPAGAYRLHHVVMHHVEDNAWGWDLSSTEGFRRDSLAGFVVYWLRFLLVSGIELPLYALRRGRHSHAATAAAAMAGGWLLTVLLWQRCAVATFYTLLLPYLVSSFALMFGNWSQHIFVDLDAPRDDYKLTYNCLACPDNPKTYNDGYHIIHHANSRLHWSEMPAAFVQQLELHDAKDALAFKGIGFFDVGLAVFTGRLGWLADRIVPCGPKQAARSRQEWVQLLQHRLQPVTRVKVA